MMVVDISDVQRVRRGLDKRRPKKKKRVERHAH